MKLFRQKPIKYNLLILTISLIYYTSYMFQTPDTVLSDTTLSAIKKIVIIPFEINSQKDISYISNGVFQMLSSRLTWKENTVVTTEKESKENFSNADYVIRGSITEYADAFSVDTTIYNVTHNSVKSFFIQADKPEQIIPRVEKLSAIINKEVFNRETSALSLSDEENQKPNLNSIRANPEKLIPQVAINHEQKEKPFWKFWGKEKNASTELKEQEEKISLHKEIDMEDDEEEIKKPFWKFW